MSKGESFENVKGQKQSIVGGSSTEKVSGSKVVSAGSAVVIDSPTLKVSKQVDTPTVITPTLTFGG